MNWNEMSETDKEALVHERLMGRCSHDFRNGSGVWVCSKCGVQVKYMKLAATPKYLTDPKACAEVKAKAAELVVYKHRDGTWSCNFMLDARDDARDATGRTEEEAVSLAALRAVGVEI